MKATELRIGNLVDTVNRSGTVHLPSNRPMKVYDIAPFGVSLYPPDKNPAMMGHIQTFDIKDICPIPLTDKILLKSGFELHHDSVYVFYSERLSVDISRLEMDWNDELRGYELKYAHQLQNIAFALTGRELTITI